MGRDDIWKGERRGEVGKSGAEGRSEEDGGLRAREGKGMAIGGGKGVWKRGRENIEYIGGGQCQGVEHSVAAVAGGRAGGRLGAMAALRHGGVGGVGWSTHTR